MGSELEELELSEDLYSDESSREEQHERLLKNRDTYQDYAWQRHRTSWPWHVLFYICGGVFAGAALLVLAVLGLSQEVKEAQHKVVEALAVKTNEYILDRSWNVNAPPQRREYRWTIRDTLHNPDGVYRPMILVNNMYPGPLIEANDGDTIVVHVDNRAVNATSIHWHGLYQNGTPWMDGTVGVTQCPIAPGSEFTYEFKIRGQHGTTWWHGHQGVQTSDGLHGPIVIHSPKEEELQKIQYDTDRVVLLSDHYHDLSSALMFQYLMPDAENAEPVPETGLINGRAVRDCDEYPHRKCDNTTSNVGLPTFHLAQNQRHRLRLINVGAFAEFQFEIDEHELAVTEVDGTDVYPQSVHRLDINPAQRYSVVVHTNSTGSTFWMRARMITHCFTDAPETVQAEALAVVTYSDAVITPQTQDWSGKLALECRDMNTSNLVPTEVIPAPKPDAVFYLRSNFEIGAYRLSRGFFNESSWRADVAAPALNRAVNGLKQNNASYALDSNTAAVNTAAFSMHRELVVQTTGIQTIDILVSNFDDGEHPLHLHGYKYFVMAQGHGAPPLTRLDAAIDKESLRPLYDTLNTTNPLRRDTASVEAFGWILLRVVADNPGMWAFHCHVSWHAEAGLLMQFLTRSDELAKLDIPRANLALCNGKGLDKGMAPDDASFEDLA